LVNGSDAIRHGAFYDLQYAQTNGQAPGYNDAKVYTYLRHSGKQKLLIVCNFDLHNSFQTTLKIPAHAWETMGLNAAERSFIFKEIFLHKTQMEVKATEGVALKLEPNSAYVFEIKSVTK
jgi:Alpha amylase, C-terminal all-beta domain